ncbi:glycoside hydrolase family 6 protein [Nocardioides lentus]|uniref:Glucanase n=1 Tax=Nocardioides lentus TaxID=338077 RepID=A0ABN2NY01_9ACTN
MRLRPLLAALALTVPLLLPASPVTASATAPATASVAASVAAADDTAARYAAPVVGAHRDNPTNPLAGRRWGVYRGPIEQAWEPYVQARGAQKELLAEIALRPKAKWFVRNLGPRQLREKVREYVRVSQAGDPGTLVQLALFGMQPWGAEMCRRVPTSGERNAYKAWVRAAVNGIGDAHTAVVLQPDLLIARCSPDGGRAIRSLVAWASRALSAAPHTSVYLDSGAWDWPNASQGGAAAAADLLLESGIRSARGFALNATHYSPVGREIRRARDLSRELAARGVPGKRGVISTTSNGRGFTFGDYEPKASQDNARTCTSVDDTAMCVMLGIPPGARVDAPGLGLDATARAAAGEYVDGWMWFGRPWLHDQASPFVHQRAYDLARSWRLKPR